jgi:GH3 auxin-responsive promoter
MAILGNVIKGGMKIGQVIRPKYRNTFKQQKRTFLKLIFKARNTEFGQKFGFSELIEEGLLSSNRAFYTKYCKNVPVYDYDKIFSEWWYKCLEGEKDITWPGKVKYFALSSGTSEASSKRIPVTKDMIKAIHRTSIRQMMALSTYQSITSKILEKGYLMLGGSIDLTYVDGHFEGDLSGITAGKIPFWFEKFYKPGKTIASVKNWEEKLDKITKKAKDWDIGFIVGVPAWIQLLLERIIKEYNLNNIHEIWPNLAVFAHGGVSFEPYKHSFEKLLGKPIDYIETYLASEGFLAYQTSANSDMHLVLNNGIFFEFVPFNDDNFDENGNIVEKPSSFLIDEIETGVDYAILISTVSGAWRYLIGDVIKFTNKKTAAIEIIGRTKHFLSLCGEHLSVDNMNKAIELSAKKFESDFREFTVIGKKVENGFCHHWYIGADTLNFDNTLIENIDNCLKTINDDYKVEREHALNNIELTILPIGNFYEYMGLKNKSGGQHKFPRVLKKADQISDWERFVEKVELKKIWLVHNQKLHDY